MDASDSDVRRFIRSAPYPTATIPQPEIVRMFAELRLLEASARRRGKELRIQELKARIFSANVFLLITEAKRFFWIGSAWIPDILQEASAAVFRAIDRYRVDGGAQFNSYAGRSIRNGLSNYFRTHARKHCSLHMTASPRKSYTGKTPCVPLTTTDITYADGTPVHEFEAEPTHPRDILAIDKLHEEIERLPTRLRRIIRLRYIDGKTCREIAPRFKLTYQRVYQLQIIAENALRARIVNLNPDRQPCTVRACGVHRAEYSPLRPASRP